MTDTLHKVIKIAVLGGTGKEGSGLATRWAHAGYSVIIGSRDGERGAAKARELNEALGGDYLAGMGNEEAAQQADIIVLTVPYSAHKDTLESVKDAVQGKMLIDVTVPVPAKSTLVNVPAGKSAALEAQALLGEGVKVISAFQDVGFVHLKDVDHVISCDILVTGDDEEAKQEALHLVEAAGMRGVDAGPLANSVAAEALAPVLMYINKKYKARGTGIRITGLA